MWEWARFAVGLAVMVAAVILILRAHGVKMGWAPAVAIIRACLQLALISVLLGAVIKWPLLVLAFILLMLTTE